MKKHIVIVVGMIFTAVLLTACSRLAETENAVVPSSVVICEKTASKQIADEEAERQIQPFSASAKESSQSEIEPQKGNAAVQTQPEEESVENTVQQEKESPSQIAEQTVPEVPAETESQTEEAVAPESESPPESTAEVSAESEPETEVAGTEQVIDIEPIEAESYDIEAHLSFARTYAESIGLILDSTAVDCWDNPIFSNSNLSNVDENITSRLNRYKNIEGFTSVWIWAVQVSENGYAIYIGYA